MDVYCRNVRQYTLLATLEKCVKMCSKMGGTVELYPVLANNLYRSFRYHTLTTMFISFQAKTPPKVYVFFWRCFIVILL